MSKEKKRGVLLGLGGLVVAGSLAAGWLALRSGNFAFWPVGVPMPVNVYESDPDYRMRQLLNQSEELQREQSPASRQ